MNKDSNRFNLSILFGLTLTLAPNANADYLENFPGMCSIATDQQPMPGHILRIGYVAFADPYGWSLLFPEAQSTVNLQRVPLLDNAGLIGQDPSRNYGQLIRMRTGPGAFVIAQIFVGDQNAEPVVTCVSRPRMLDNYSPSYFGAEWSWLNRHRLRHWLNRGSFVRWKWSKYYGSGFFDDYRRRFKRYWNDDRRNKYRKFRRERRDRDDDRFDRDWKRKDGDGKKFQPGWRLEDSDKRRRDWKVGDDESKGLREQVGEDPGRTIKKGWRSEKVGESLKKPLTFKGPEVAKSSGFTKKDFGQAETGKSSQSIEGGFRKGGTASFSGKAIVAGVETEWKKKKP